MQEIECPDCGVWFTVIWNQHPIAAPEYCPFCGNKMDYFEASTREV